MTYRLVKYKSGNQVWFEIEERISLFFGLIKYWKKYRDYSPIGEDTFQYLEDAEKQIHELRYPTMVEKTILE